MHKSEAKPTREGAMNILKLQKFRRAFSPSRRYRLGRALGAGLIAILPLGSSFPAESPTVSATFAEFHNLESDLRTAHATHDTVAYLAGSQALLRLLNGSPEAVLQLMSAEAFCGDESGALSSYEQYVRMGQSSEPTLQNKTFDELRKNQKFSNIHAEMAKNDAVISKATPMFEISDANTIPEDIDYDSQSKSFYITSVLRHNVVIVDMNGRSRVFAEAPDRWPTMALKVDSRRGRLWVTEVALTASQRYRKVIGEGLQS